MLEKTDDGKCLLIHVISPSKIKKIYKMKSTVTGNMSNESFDVRAIREVHICFIIVYIIII